MSRVGLDSWTCSSLHCAWRKNATSANILLLLCELPCSLSEFCSSQPSSGAQAGLVPPHNVLALTSDQAALHRTVPVPRSSFRAEGEAEAGCAVADLEQTIRNEERLSLTSSHIVSRLKVIVNCNVAELLPSLHPPPPPQEDNARH